MIIDTDIVLSNLDGKKIKLDNEELTLSKALAVILIDSNESDKIKLYNLAKKIYSGGNVELDNSEIKIILSVINSSKAFPVLITGQCGSMLNQDESNKKK